MTRHRMRERRKRHQARRQQMEQFADAICRGAIVYAPPALFNAVQAASERVAIIGGIDVRSSRYCPPDMIVAIHPDHSLPIPNDPMFDTDLEDLPFRFSILR